MYNAVPFASNLQETAHGLGQAFVEPNNLPRLLRKRRTKHSQELIYIRRFPVEPSMILPLNNSPDYDSHENMIISNYLARKLR